MIQEKIRPVVDLYVREQVPPDDRNRGIKRIDLEWQSDTEVALPSFDTALAEQIELALARVDNQITVMDIGCDRGGLFEDSIVRLQLLQKTAALLAANPTFKIRFVGLTDAKNTADFLKRHTIFDVNRPNLSAEVYQYTLAPEQTMEAFFRSTDIQQSELILATWSLAYMDAVTFQKVLEDGLAALKSQGKMIVHGYLNKHPDFLVKFGVPILRMRDVTDVSPVWQQNLQAILRGEFWQRKMSFTAYLGAIAEVEQHFKDMPEFDEQYFVKKSEILNSTAVFAAVKRFLLGKSEIDEELKKLRLKFDQQVIAALRRMGERKIFELSQEKLRILQAFITSHGDSIATIQHSTESILLEKK